MENEFATLLMLATYPLRRLNALLLPDDACSGALVQLGLHRVLLTASHKVAPDELWAVETRYEPGKGTQLWQLGCMDYILAIEGDGRLRDVDFAFCRVPPEVRAYHQQFSNTGGIISEIERVVLLSDLTAIPTTGQKYGFSGITRFTLEPAPPFLPYNLIGGEVQIETQLTFIGTRDQLDVYKLDRNHPGHAVYKGCSGAPIVSDQGDLVGLVLSGCKRESTIFGLPLRLYAGAVGAALAT